MYYDKTIPLSQYKDEKIEILSQLGIKLTVSERTELLNLKNEIQVDNYARKLILALEYKPTIYEKRKRKRRNG